MWVVSSKFEEGTCQNPLHWKLEAWCGTGIRKHSGKTNVRPPTGKEGIERMNGNPFRKIEHDEAGYVITFYGKVGSNWEQMEAFLQKLYKNDPHLKMVGIGEEGTADFKVVITRRGCSPRWCNCAECDDDDE